MRGLSFAKTAAALAALTVLVCALAGAPAEAASARPDAALFAKAGNAAARLQASATRQKKAREWESVVDAYRAVVHRYPKSPYSDNALLAVGDLYSAMAVRFKDRRYRTQALNAYRAVVAEYPSSSKGEEALHKVFELASASKDRNEIADAAKAYLEAFPHGRHARTIKAALRQRTPAAPAEVIPKEPPPGLAQIFGVRFWSGDRSTRVVIDLERQVKIQHERLESPARILFDLDRTRLHPNLLKAARLPVGDGLLEAIRMGQYRADVVRVVLDLKKVKEHSTFFLQNPSRLVIDVVGEGEAAKPDPFPTLSPLEAAAVAATPTPTPSLLAPPSPTPIVVAANATATPAPAPIATLQPTPTPTPRAEVRAAESTATPAPPQANRAGSYSLARQLGLGARTIVIDAGHGGHDPGTIGTGGLQEKDLVLDIALRLEALVRSELGADVLMTRSTDVFIPLEERTGIANSRGADLFLSIHANSSRNRTASGIETYYLNFARDPHAEEVAARENAISAATMKDLQPLVKAIALNSKINESADFAACVHESMLANLKPHNPHAKDRRVRTAPFYVLIGANMPSILAEIAFLSNPNEEKLLRSGDYKDRVARSLLAGVRKYLDALNRAPIPQLTSQAPRSRVNSSARTLPSLGDKTRGARARSRR